MPGPFFCQSRDSIRRLDADKFDEPALARERSPIPERGCCANDGDALCGDAAHGDANRVLSDDEWLRDS